MVREQDETIIKELWLVRLYEIAQFDMLLENLELKWHGDDHRSYLVIKIASILKVV